MKESIITIKDYNIKVTSGSLRKPLFLNEKGKMRTTGYVLMTYYEGRVEQVFWAETKEELLNNQISICN